jgi:hypothetical protein
MLQKSAGVRRPLFSLSGRSGLSRLFGFSGSSNKTNQTDQMNQRDLAHPERLSRSLLELPVADFCYIEKKEH